MSNIRFLDNAVNGKNNWVSYLLTISITVIWGDIGIYSFDCFVYVSIFFKYENYPP